MLGVSRCIFGGEWRAKVAAWEAGNCGYLSGLFGNVIEWVVVGRRRSKLLSV